MKQPNHLQSCGGGQTHTQLPKGRHNAAAKSTRQEAVSASRPAEATTPAVAGSEFTEELDLSCTRRKILRPQKWEVTIALVTVYSWPVSPHLFIARYTSQKPCLHQKRTHETAFTQASDAWDQ